MDLAGFDTLWLYETYFVAESIARAGFIAASTKHVKIGAGVINPYSRHPGLTALAVATLDRLSSGRLTLLMGAGRTSWMRDMLGFKRRATGDLENAVRVIRKMIANENVTFSSPGFSLKNASMDEQTFRSDLPIYLAAPNDLMVKLASHIADGIFLGPRLPTAHVRRATELVKKWRPASSSKPIEVGAEYPLRITSEPEKELQTLKPTLAYYLSLPGIGEEYLKLAEFDTRMLGPIREALKTPALIAQGKNPYDAFKVGDIAEAAKNIPDELMEQCSVVGTPGKCRERIAELEGAGLTFVALAFQRSFDQTIQRLEELLS